MEIFTERELEVLYWLIMGLTNKEIAQKLVISDHTIKAHIASIYKKIGVSNRVQAAIKSFKLGAIEYFGIDTY